MFQNIIHQYDRSPAGRSFLSWCPRGDAWVIAREIFRCGTLLATSDQEILMMTFDQLALNIARFMIPVALCGSIASFSSASSNGDELESIASEISVLKERNQRLLGRLDDRSDDAWLSDARKAEINTLVQDVLADSGTRQSLLGPSLDVGYSDADGFHITTADDTFSLNIRGMLQTRWVFNHSQSGQGYTNLNAIADNSTGSNTRIGSENGWGFQIQRAKVTFQGHVVDPSWRYKLETNFRRNGTAVFQDAYVIKQFEDGFSIRTGQFKEAWLREQLVSDRRQLAVERSVINGFFGQGRSLGIEGRYQNDTFNVTVGSTNGMRTTLQQGGLFTNFSDSPTDWSFFGRLQYIIAGSWDDFRSLNASIDSKTSVMVGVAGMTQKYGENSNDRSFFGAPLGGVGGALPLKVNLDGSMVSGLTADISIKHRDLTFFAAFVWQTIAAEGTGLIFNPTPASYSVPRINPWGFVVQGGFAATEEIELFARYSYLDADMDSLVIQSQPISLPYSYGSSVSSVITLGVNWFLSDKVKVTVDTGLNTESAFAGITTGRLSGGGWVPTSTSDQWNIRAQLQLLF
jgi:hypothetical protein